MPQIVPFTPSEPHARFATVLNGITCIIEQRWNDRDEAWYFDVFDSEETPIASNIKIVLGVHLGRRFTHPLFVDGLFVASDTSGKSRDALFDDLGTRVEVHYYTMFEVVAKMRANEGRRR